MCVGPGGWLRGTLALGLLAGCGSASDHPSYDGLAPAAGPGGVETVLAAAKDGPPPRLDWSDAARDCLGALRRLHAAARAGRLAPDEEPPFTVLATVMPDAPGWSASKEPPVERDLPLLVEAYGRGPIRTPCIIRVGAARDLRSDQRVLGEEVVRSAYQSGTRSEKNPEYDLAQARVRQAERELKDADAGILKVGDPMLDLVGLLVGGIITGVAGHGDERELEEALEQLAATPRSHEQPVYRPYHFERIVIHARKSATVPLALVNPAGREVRRIELRQREERRIHILEGLDPRDRDYEQHRAESMSRLELNRWAETAPRLRLSSLVAALVDGPAETQFATPEDGLAPGHGPPEPARRADLAEVSLPLRASQAAASAAALGPGSGADARASIVRIAGQAEGRGFYVRPHLVLTASALIRHQSLVDVTTADGATVLGLVAADDPAQGVALVHVPKPGAPLLLADAGQPTPRRRARSAAGGDARLGAPVLVGGSVSGMVVASGDAHRLVGAPSLRAFVQAAAGTDPGAPAAAP